MSRTEREALQERTWGERGAAGRASIRAIVEKRAIYIFKRLDGTFATSVAQDGHVAQRGGIVVGVSYPDGTYTLA